MKSDHRHELKTNELAEWIANFPQWAKENRIMIISVLLVIAVVGAVYIWRIHNRNVTAQKQIELTRLLSQLLGTKMQILGAQAQGKDLSYMLLRPAGSLATFAQTERRATRDEGRTMAALALIKRADALRMELHYRPGTVDKQDLIEQINAASASYTEALKTGAANRELAATAKFGLGLCQEELGNFEAARQIYQQVTAEANLEGTIAQASAKQRLAIMTDYQTAVVFKASAKPKPAAVENLPIEIKPAEANLPIPKLVGDVNQAPATPNNP